MAVKLKRAYEAPTRADGYRVLVDRLWPRGVRKDDLRVDQWSKEVAPSTALRQWYAHEPERWSEFQRRYLDELDTDEGTAQLRALAGRAATGTVTLVFSARDTDHNNAVVLKGAIERRARRRTTRRR